MPNTIGTAPHRARVFDFPASIRILLRPRSQRSPHQPSTNVTMRRHRLSHTTLSSATRSRWRPPGSEPRQRGGRASAHSQAAKWEADDAADLSDAAGLGAVGTFGVGCLGVAAANLLACYSAYVSHSSRLVFGHLPMAALT